MNRISVVMKMYAKDKTTWFTIPWATLSFIFLLNWFISSFLDHPMYTGGFSYYFVYLLVIGITSLIYTFPFALSFGTRRKDYFLGTIAMFVIVSAFSALILTLLSFAELSLGGWGTELHFFNLPYMSDGNLLEQFWILFALMLHLYLLGSVISSVYLRFSGKGVYFFFTVLLLLGTAYSFFATRFRWWVEIFNWLKNHTAFDIASWLGLVAVCYALVTYLLLRRATLQ